MSESKNQITNSKPHDSSSKIIFGNAELCSQFLRNYMDMPILKNIRAEDIEDVSERYLPMFTEERNSDMVKRVKIFEKIHYISFPLLNIKQMWITIYVCSFFDIWFISGRIMKKNRKRTR